MSLLEVKDLFVEYDTSDGIFKAVNGINLNIEEGETLGLVGETGAGKTTTALSILRLVANPPGVIKSGQILFDGKDILQMKDHEIRHIRGKDISMIFQDPMTALNPTIPVGQQISEVIEQHERCSKADALKKALDMLEMVGIEKSRGNDYPHQFSGGMKQRVVIAIALACSPRLLLADEPTTALDVTIQAQVLEMMNSLKVKMNTAMLMITHDLGIVAECCDKVAVMYAGQIVEYGTRYHIFKNVQHPYTIGLFHSLPSLDKDVHRLKPIPGLMPDPSDLPKGCSFSPRCPFATDECRSSYPKAEEVEPGHIVCCFHPQKGSQTNE